MAENFLWLGEGVLRILGSAIISVVAVVFVVTLLFLCLLAIGKVMERFVKEVKDPDLGVVRIGFGQCDGMIVIEGRRRLAFQLPAEKKQILAEARTLLLTVQLNWPRLENLLLDHFAREVENDGVPLDLIKRAKWVEKIARERDLENLRRFTRPQSINIQYADKRGPLEIRIETLHRWDPEHERVLILDEKLNEKLYALGCQC